MSPDNIPSKMVLRIRGYGHRTKRGTWIAACIDLDLYVERPSWEEAKAALHEQICSYVKAVVDTTDKKSVPQLLYRPVPLGERVKYYWACTIHRLNRRGDINPSSRTPSTKRMSSICFSEPLPWPA